MLGVNALCGGGVNFDSWAWTPARLNLALWLDASDSSTITHSSNDITQWRDKSGNARHFSQTAGSGVQPKTNTTSQNGLNTVDFSADYLTSDNAASTWNFLHDGTLYTAFAVVKFGNAADPNAFYGLFGTNAGSTNGVIGCSIYFDDRAAVPRNEVVGHLVGNGLTTVGLREVINNNSANAFYSPNAYHLLEVYGDPSNGTAASRSTIWRDAAASAANNSHTNAPSSSNATYTAQIGAIGNNVGPMTGQIGEMFIAIGSLTAGEIASARSYLDTKWNTPA